MRDRDVTLRFLAAPTDINVHGKVPGGRILEWIDKAGYAAAVAWSGQYCVTAYVGNVVFENNLTAAELVEVRARVLSTGRSSMFVLAEVFGSDPRSGARWRVARCGMVMVGTDGKGRTVRVPAWEPQTDEDRRLADDAAHLADSRQAIEQKMSEAVYSEAGTSPRLTLRFLARPTDVNFGGKVHGGTVMGWIDEAAEACAAGWTNGHAISVYAGGVRFYQPMFIGDLVEVDARLLYTAESRLHVSVHVRSGSTRTRDLRLTAHCLMILDALDDQGRIATARPWRPTTAVDAALADHAQSLQALREEQGLFALFAT